MKHKLKTNLLAVLLVWIILTLPMPLDAQIPMAEILNKDIQPQVSTNHSSLLQVEPFGFTDLRETRKTWNRNFRTLNKSHEGPDQALLDQMKQLKTQQKFSTLAQAAAEPASKVAGTPTIGRNFLGTEMHNGTPPDNTIAISNGGKIVALDNSSIEVYDDQGNYLLTREAHFDFYNNSNLTSTIYDPRVLYDSGSDRFIIVLLHGNSPSTSELLISFSRTNDPMDGFYNYVFPANIGHANLWFDFPNMAVSNHELFISGNMFTASGNFQGNVVFQIDKSLGYNGSTINYQYWSDVQDGNGNLAFTIVPVSYGHQNNYGPGIYMVSNSSSQGNEIHLYEITDRATASNETLNQYAISTTAYEVGGDVAQQGTNGLLSNGDCRIQNGFYLNGIIHFVFASDISNGWNGINYNRLNVSNLSNSSQTFGLSGTYDYCFPSVASSSLAASDKSVMIGFLRSGSSIYPQVRVVNVDDGGNWSSSVLVKGGEDYVNLINGTDRWGDYSTTVRKHNASIPTTWVKGCYGVSTNFYNVSKGWNAWVAEIQDLNVSSPEVKNQIISPNRVFPNPVMEDFQYRFNLEVAEAVSIAIYDLNGKQIKVLYRDWTRKGEHILSFNRNALSNGTYLLKLENNEQILDTQKFTVQY